MQNYRWVILSLAWFAYLQSFFHRMAFPPLLPPIMKDLDLTFTMAGSFMSAFLVAYAAFQFPSGYLADRFKYQSYAPLSLAILGVASVCFGLIANFSQGILVRAIMGIGGAMVYVPGMRLLANWFSRKERGTAIGIYTTALGAGSVLAMILMPILQVSVGWRMSFLLVAFPTFLAAILCKLLVKSEPTEIGLRRIESPKGEGQANASEAGLRAILLGRNMWLMNMSMFLYAGAFYGFYTFAPAYLSKVLQGSLIYAGTILGLSTGLLAAGIVVFGWISDKIGQRKAVYVSGEVAVGICFALVAIVRESSTLLILILLAGWFMGSEILGYVLASEFHSAAVAGKVTGFVSLFSHMGGVILPIIVGFIVDSYASYIIAFIFISAILFVGAILGAMVRERR